MKKLATCAALLATLSISAVALADEPAATPEAQAPQAMRGVITVPDVIITSRYMRPQAAISVARIEPRLTLVELKQLFVARIEESLLRGAF